ncbi:MAG: hypothetical protein ACRENE_12030 [Polyangiaceae bacterium]
MSDDASQSTGRVQRRVGRHVPPWVARWAFAAVPCVGLFELGTHAWQVRSVVPASDWQAARVYLEAAARPEDLIAFAPRWVDPVGRAQLGTALATFEREGRGDESGFPRAFEVSIRGAHLRALEGWTRVDERRFGGVTAATLANPTPVHVLDDLVSMVDPARMAVFTVDSSHANACPFAHASTQAGALGFGPAVPGDRFDCMGTFVGVSVMADLEYRPRRCIYAPPPGPGGHLRLHFQGVHMGRTLYGHHGIYVEAERNRTGSPVTIRFTSGGSVVGEVVHKDGDGWKAFEFDTADLAGKTADLDAEISAPAADRRMYCFEATTR